MKGKSSTQCVLFLTFTCQLKKLQTSGRFWILKFYRQFIGNLPQNATEKVKLKYVRSLVILKKVGFLFKKNWISKTIYFFNKTPNFERSEKFYYFSCILRQMCCNFVEKVNKSECSWQRREKTFHLGGRFSSHITNMAENNENLI